MLIKDKDFGRIEVNNIPLPEDMEDFNGTYTCSGRVLVSARLADRDNSKDRFRVVTVNDDGTDMREVFTGEIPQRDGANGIRWMCFADNKRILLGDYVLECTPDIDNCREARLVRIIYPEGLDHGKHIFMRWSEIIIAPDNIHMCWTMLTINGAVNYLGRLVRREECYELEDVSIVSTIESSIPDPCHEGCVLPQPMRGGEVKQFVRGGKALTMVGNGDSITESIIQMLDSEEIIQITDTPGYEETTIFSPDEKLGVVMSPRFSEKTSCAVFGLVPLPHSMAVRSKIFNVLYMYCVSGVRAFRKGNIGPVLIDIERSCREGRAYSGVNLSDPEGKWVYYSPISWHPDSMRAMWNERTRLAEGQPKCRLRMCRLLDKTPGEPVSAAVTPDTKDIPYAVPVTMLQQMQPEELPIKIMGKNTGYVLNYCTQEGAYETVYQNFSDDGKTFYNGTLSITAPSSIFAAGETVFEADLEVRGIHNGEIKLRAVFRREGVHAPAMLSFALDEEGKPQSFGYSSYDGVTIDISGMEP